MTIGNNKVFLEVASNNLIAIHLYDKLGFKSFGIRKNYYSVSENKKVNAILMKKIISFGYSTNYKYMQVII